MALKKSQNLYRCWVVTPAYVLERLPSVPLLQSELLFAEIWSAKQTSFGIRAGIYRDESGMPRVVAIFGPDDMVPDRIMYPFDNGFRVDEFTGDSAFYPDLDTALLEVAPLH